MNNICTYFQCVISTNNFVRRHVIVLFYNWLKKHRIRILYNKHKKKIILYQEKTNSIAIENSKTTCTISILTDCPIKNLDFNLLPAQSFKNNNHKILFILCIFVYNIFHSNLINKFIKHSFPISLKNLN